MDKLDINSWEEVFFEHRNREYGAYPLRYNYPYYLTVSALIVISLFLTIMIGLNKWRSKKEQVHIIREVRVINYNELSEPPPIEKIYVPPKRVVAKQAKVEKYVPPVVIQEKIEEPEEIITVEEVKEVINPTDSTVDSDSDESTEGFETGTEAPLEPIFDINPGFPGGRGSLMDWLAKNLKYPIAAKRMGIEGKVVVEFLVDENGKISEVTTIESLHRLCDREAIRLVKLMPVWIPGVKNGIIIRGRHTLEIPFVIK
jgi:protein TonB